jgi:hypothetical protein
MEGDEPVATVTIPTPLRPALVGAGSVRTNDVSALMSNVNPKGIFPKEGVEVGAEESWLLEIVYNMRGGLLDLIDTTSPEPSGIKEICAGPVWKAGGVVRFSPNERSQEDITVRPADVKEKQRSPFEAPLLATHTQDPHTVRERGQLKPAG